MPEAPPQYVISDNPEKHRFEADLGDGSIAFAEYNLPRGKIVFTHTEVPEAHEGHGIGSALIHFALASARERGLQVIPICPFFAAYIKKYAEEQDLIRPTARLSASTVSPRLAQLIGVPCAAQGPAWRIACREGLEIGLLDPVDGTRLRRRFFALPAVLQPAQHAEHAGPGYDGGDCDSQPWLHGMQP